MVAGKTLIALALKRVSKKFGYLSRQILSFKENPTIAFSFSQLTISKIADFKCLVEFPCFYTSLGTRFAL